MPDDNALTLGRLPGIGSYDALQAITTGTFRSIHDPYGAPDINAIRFCALRDIVMDQSHHEQWFQQQENLARSHCRIKLEVDRVCRTRPIEKDWDVRNARVPLL